MLEPFDDFDPEPLASVCIEVFDFGKTSKYNIDMEIVEGATREQLISLKNGFVQALDGINSLIDEML